MEEIKKIEIILTHGFGNQNMVKKIETLLKRVKKNFAFKQSSISFPVKEKQNLFVFSAEIRNQIISCKGKIFFSSNQIMLSMEDIKIPPGSEHLFVSLMLRYIKSEGIKMNILLLEDK
ncbi:hypothetical protein K8Q94_01075 [Candidatus Nomurabacteria bacterium]|nr:hypothetical protein [Candidatus Nomurabacteria bacterium]